MKLKSPVLLSTALLAFVANTGFGQTPDRISSIRDPQISYVQYVNSHRVLVKDGQYIPDLAIAADQITPNQIKKLPELKSHEQLKELMLLIRDKRYLPDPRQDPHSPLFLRRISWLYPQDGCFARAELMKEDFVNQHVISPYKVFIFGNLMVRTSNAPGGIVSWWFHVVPIYRVGDEPYVLDPAIEPTQPLRLLSWIQRQVEELKDAKIVFCTGNSYSPDSDCDEKEPVSKDAALAEMPYFLDMERFNLLQLGRNADRELGDLPPWLDSLRN